MDQAPRCPQCNTVVQPTWDWCHGCGFDPDGLRPPTPTPGPSAALPPAPPVAPPVSPTAPAPPPPPAAAWTAAPTAPNAPAPPHATPPYAAPAPPPPPFTPPPYAAPTSFAPPPGGPTPSTGTGNRSLAIIAGTVVAALVIIVGAAVVLANSSRNRSSERAVQRADASSTPTTDAGTGAAPTGSSQQQSGHPDAMFATPTDGSVVDAAVAAKVTDAWWTVRQPAWKAHDATKLATVEAGPALQIDAVDCIGGCTSNLTGDGERSYSIPPQSTYPARFLAQLQFEGNVGGGAAYQSYFVVFTRQSANDPWLAVNVSTNGSRQGALTAAGPDHAVTDDVPTLTGSLDPTTLPTELAAFFQSYKATGAPPASSILSDNGGLHQIASDLFSIHVSLTTGYGVDDNTQYRSSADDDGFFTFAAGNGDLLACSAIRWSTTIAPTSGRATFTVPADPNSPFSAQIAPGNYRRIEQVGVRQACWSVTPSCDCVVTLGLNGRAYEVTTDPS